MDLFAKPNPNKALRIREIKSQVAELLGLDEQATVMVTELNCKDADCPEVETVIAIFCTGRPKVQVALRSSIEEIGRDEIESFRRGIKDNPGQSSTL